VQVFVACDMVEVHKQATQQELWERIGRDPYMVFALQEAFYTLRIILEHLLVDDQGGRWYVCALIDVNHTMFFSLSFKQELKVRLRISLLSEGLSGLYNSLGFLKQEVTSILQIPSS